MTKAGILLKSPESRLIAHALIAGFAAFAALYWGSGQPTDHALFVAALAAGARAGLGFLTSTNPKVGKNIL